MKKIYNGPSLVDISITNKCNLKCDFCYDDKDELNLKQFKKLFDEFSQMNILRIALSGGEPFIRKDFFDILKLASEYQFAIIINTNGTFINNKICEQLKKIKFERICVSVDGSNAKQHDMMRGKGSFEKTVRGIQLLKEYELPVSTLITLTDNNIDHLIDTIKFNESLGIEYVSVMVVCPTGRGANSDLLLSKKKWYPIFLKLSQMKKNGEIKVKLKIVPPNEGEIFWSHYFPLKYYDRLDLLEIWNQDITNIDNNAEYMSCQAGTYSATISYDGKVYGCDLMMDIEEFCTGNLHTTSFSHIWYNSDIFNTLRKIKKKDLEGKCGNCEYTWCGGGCRSAAYNLTGKINGSDQSCFLIREETCNG